MGAGIISQLPIDIGSLSQSIDETPRAETLIDIQD
jgi:hypothetical protein